MKKKPLQHYVRKTILVPVVARAKPQPRAARLDQIPGVLCHGQGGKLHPLPALCAYKGMTLSNKGQPAAAYRCPLCGTEHHFVNDSRSGKPLLLWTSH